MKKDQALVNELARLLEIAAQEQNESADATCSVAACFDFADGDLSNEALDSVFESVTKLAGSLHKKPAYRSAARELIARIRRISPRSTSGTKASPRRKRG
jgi:hypothetical protein